MHIIFVLSISSKIPLQVIESDEKHSIKQTIKKKKKKKKKKKTINCLLPHVRIALNEK